MSFTDASPPRDLPGRSGSIPTLAVLIIGALAVMLFAFSPRLNPIDVVTGRVFDVDIPDVVGKTQTRALVDLQETPLTGSTEFAYSAKVERGYVISQEPEAGERIQRDDDVVITVSRGPASVKLVSYTGKMIDEVTKELGKSEVEVEFTKENNEFFLDGMIMEQTPKPGTIVSGGDTVVFVVSSGPIERQIPEITSLPVEGAAFLLGQAGFTIKEIVTEDNPLVPKDAVIGTDPASGTVAARDTGVVLRISTGGAKITVPDVRGASAESAAKELADNRLTIAEVSAIGSIDDPNDGQVIAQNPKAGTVLSPGDIVTLTVRRKTVPVPSTIVPPTTLPRATTTTTTTIPPNRPPSPSPSPEPLEPTSTTVPGPTTTTTPSVTTTTTA